MKVTNGIKIAMANKPLCYKTLLSRTLISSILTFACFLIAGILINDVKSSDAYLSFVKFLRTSLRNFIAINDASNTNFATEFGAHIQAILETFKSNVGELVTIVIGVVAVIELAKFVTGVCDYVVAVNVNEHMSSLRHAKFFSTLVEHFRPAVRYATYCVVSLFFYNTFIIAVSLVIFITCIGSLGLATLPIIMFFVLFADAFRLMLVGMVPAKMVCEGVSATVAFREAFKGLDAKTMLERFISYFTMRVLYLIVTGISVMPTCGISLIITMPLFSVSYIAVRFVDYYTVSIKKYYINFDNIVIPKQLRTKVEQLLNQVDVDAYAVTNFANRLFSQRFRTRSTRTLSRITALLVSNVLKCSI